MQKFKIDAKPGKVNISNTLNLSRPYPPQDTVICVSCRNHSYVFSVPYRNLENLIKIHYKVLYRYKMEAKKICLL